jgi:light-regulated signal transduction histidine kinase (bacteriophytochrome)
MAVRESGAVVTHGELPVVLGDEPRIAQVFQNLIGNASSSARRGRCRGSTSRPCEGEREWTFSVRDNGIGLDPNYGQRIFQIFQRLHGREEYPGTGIGLAICKKIVARHGGRIWVESVPGEGSVFRFSVPCEQKPRGARRGRGGAGRAHVAQPVESSCPGRLRDERRRAHVSRRPWRRRSWWSTTTPASAVCAR